MRSGEERAFVGSFRRVAFPFGLAALSAAVLATAVGCVPTFDDRTSLVTERRVVAVQTSPPEVEAGETTTLTALVVAPLDDSGDDGAEPEPLEWALCEVRKPLTELGPVAQACVDGTLAEALAPPSETNPAGSESGEGDPVETEEAGWVPLGAGLRVEAPVSRDACRLFGPIRPPAEGDKPAGRPVDADVTGGYHQPVILGTNPSVVGAIRLSCGAPGLPGDELVTYNRGFRPNENPRIQSLEVRARSRGGAASAPSDDYIAVVSRGAELELTVVWDECPEEPVCGDGLCTSGEDQVTCAEDCQTNPRGCTGAETYVWGNPETRRAEARRESMRAAWYATDGRFESEQTGRTEAEATGIEGTGGDAAGPDTSNRWTAPNGPGEVALWVVLRDDRGGVDWREYHLLVE